MGQLHREARAQQYTKIEGKEGHKDKELTGQIRVGHQIQLREGKTGQRPLPAERKGQKEHRSN